MTSWYGEIQHVKIRIEERERQGGGGCRRNQNGKHYNNINKKTLTWTSAAKQRTIMDTSRYPTEYIYTYIEYRVEQQQ